MLQRLRLWVKREPVLAISAACAVLLVVAMVSAVSAVTG